MATSLATVRGSAHDARPAQYSDNDQNFRINQKDYIHSVGVAGINLAHIQESAHAHVLGVHFILFDNTFENDQGIPFESYQYVLDMIRLKLGNAGLHEQAQHMRSSAHFVAIKLSESLKGETRVVENLQRTLAIYKMGKKEYP